MLEPGERFNTLTHLAGFALGLVGLIALLVLRGDQRSALLSAGTLVFALAVLFLFAASTLCHASHGAAKRLWQRLDHVAIFVLIAGTATPFALVLPLDAWGLVGLVTIWAVASAGVLKELWRRDQARPSVLVYVAVGWLAVAVAFRACLELPMLASVLLIAGGLVYTAGTLFYLNPRGLQHAHGIWHLFVLAGVATHYAAVLVFAS